MMPYHADHDATLYAGDSVEVMRTLPDSSMDCVVTSPPYFGLRDYGHPGQYGLEPTPAEYVARMVAVFTEVRRLLRADGVLWLNLGDSYSTYPASRGPSDLHAGEHHDALPARPKGFGLSAPVIPAKNLIGMPWRVAFALQDDGWVLRSDVIWHKPNPMPESVRDRPSTTHEHLFLLATRPRYWFDLDAIREPLTHPEALDGTRTFGGKNKGAQGGVGASARRRGHSVYGDKRSKPGGAGRNPGDVWTLATQPYPDAHFAVMPPKLARRCILAGCRPGGTVLDPFSGSGTTGMVARQLGRRYVGIDLRAEYHDLAVRRLGDTPLPLDAS